MFFTCSAIAKVWFLRPLALKVLALPILPFPELWIHLYNQLHSLDTSDKAISLFSFIIWHIWKARNGYVFEKILKKPQDISLQATQEWLEYLNFHKPTLKISGQTANSGSLMTRWKPPPHGFIKLNYDAATDKTSKSGSIKVVATDHLCNIISRFSIFYRHIWDPRVLEFLALRDAMLWARSNQWERVTLEGDVTEVTQTINHHLSSNSQVWGIYLYIQHLQDLSKYLYTD
ncbi:uncharacterized protein LOC126687556 [Mercurialis annua]|uniref:uncharacterized protein LOC126687556 n=1 Tax=Mercurialis annua TaxID=3986 RepID=UPI002160F316|nr:uncharacterized protein LOC126687556 [Mercurialis annua]